MTLPAFSSGFWPGVLQKQEKAPRPTPERSGKSRAMDFKVGDEVRVFDVNGPRRGQPVAGYPGTVTKAGRKLFTVTYGGCSQVFRLDTGQSNDAYGHQSVKTLEQAELDARRGRAVGTLREHEITIGVRNSLTVEHLEALADLVRQFAERGSERAVRELMPL